MTSRLGPVASKAAADTEVAGDRNLPLSAVHMMLILLFRSARRRFSGTGIVQHSRFWTSACFEKKSENLEGPAGNSMIIKSPSETGVTAEVAATITPSSPNQAMNQHALRPIKGRLLGLGSCAPSRFNPAMSGKCSCTRGH